MKDSIDTFVDLIKLKKTWAIIFAFLIIIDIPYIVDEGHVGIKKQFGEAVSAESPGLHLKIPFVHKIEELEVRTRKSSETMSSSTSEQMPITVIASVNWSVDRVAVLDLYKQYGGLTQFEDRILDPRFRAAVKDVMPEYTAEEMVQDRSLAQAKIELKIIEDASNFPITISDMQIENIQLPAKYIASIETKQTEKNLAAAEKHKLQKQALVAQQAVNTARAQKEAAMLQADGKAYATLEQAKAEAESTRVKGLAEADAIEAKAKSLKNNPLIVELTQAQQWDGSLPRIVMGEGGGLPILDMREVK